jgi:hypothetical protein
MTTQTIIILLSRLPSRVGDCERERQREGERERERERERKREYNNGEAAEMV